MEPLALAGLTVNNSALMSGAATGGDTLLEADEGLVHFNSATVAAERGSNIAGAHGLADAMREEPRALVSDFQNAVQLVGADALLPGHDQVNGLEHLVERDAGIVEHGAHLDGELLAAFTTLLDAVAKLAFGLLLAGLGAKAGPIVHAAISMPQCGRSLHQRTPCFQGARKSGFHHGNAGTREMKW